MPPCWLCNEALWQIKKRFSKPNAASMAENHRLIKQWRLWNSVLDKLSRMSQTRFEWLRQDWVCVSALNHEDSVPSNQSIYRHNMPLSFRQLFSCIKLADLQAKTCENHLHAWIQHDPAYPINIRTYSKSTNQNSDFRCSCRSQVIKCHLSHLMHKWWGWVPCHEHMCLYDQCERLHLSSQVDKRTSMGAMLGSMFPPDPRHLAPRKELRYTDTEDKGLDEKSKWNAWSYSFWVAACSWDVERDKETKKLRNSHTLACVIRKQITAPIAHRVNISVRNTQMIHY